MRREQWGGEERCPEWERGCLIVRDNNMVGPERRCWLRAEALPGLRRLGDVAAPQGGRSAGLVCTLGSD